MEWRRHSTCRPLAESNDVLPETDQYFDPVPRRGAPIFSSPMKLTCLNPLEEVRIILRCEHPRNRFMEPHVEITFKEIDQSDAVEARIRERVKKLSEMSENIRSCKVWVRAPHRRGRKPTAYVIDLSVQMTGTSLHVDHRPGDDNAHTDIYVAIRDAFNAMERQLRKWKDQHKGRPTHLETPLQGRIESLDWKSDCGQIATTDGRLIYFHRNSVVGDGYDNLNEGDAVELSVDTKDADEGPHASFVRPVSALRFVDKAS